VSVAWQGYPASGARIFVSAEADDFASTSASETAPGVPCECCPLDLLLDGDGRALLAFRNNDGNIREMWAALATDGVDFASSAPISTSEQTVPTCPMQGPRMAQLGDTLLAVWSTRGPESTGSVLVATSTDDGASWSGGTPISGFQADEPTIAVGASGRVHVTGVTGTSVSKMVFSDDGGASWSEPETLEAPDGGLAIPQAEGGAGAAALVAVSSSGTLWLRRME
jgi:hypothetical protein